MTTRAARATQPASNPARDPAFAFARHVAQTPFEALPAVAVEATKKDILDTLGAALAGSAAAGGREVAELVADWGGAPQSTVWVYGTRAPAHHAALANGNMGHALDFDDTHDRAILHAGVTTIPALLAAAEHGSGQSRPVSGRTALAALATSIDMIARMGLAIRRGPGDTGWIYTPLLGFFGAAAAAARAYGLDEERTLHALGIAYAQTAGNNQCVPDAALTKRLQAGFAAQGGVLSAQLAQRGVTGAKQIAQGKYGFYHVYLNDDYDPAPLLADLGERFEVADLSFKPYPCCRAGHGAIDATLALREQHQLDPANVERVDVRTSNGPYELLGDPIERKRNPAVVVDAQFSLPFMVATALSRGRVFIDDFTPESIRDNTTLALANRVFPAVDPEIERSAPKTYTTVVEVTTRDGGRYSHRVEQLKGDPRNPMTYSDVADKFRACAAYAARPLASDQVERVVEIVARLERIDDVAELAALLT
ncbi:MAG: MmgE/PrpD family protein [Chloroflexi bacterium]|nr:MmgE/PrpD family protein [Chloroflexota bacterium]